ncbi:uncharacterized protein LOC127795360 isoform X2 [Diospyros lotus]|uniref:uncharacterized protein LOC127795360 isoform X2 n=1 Tax=Diospyros lotus TaxID=55363 RepID=UPI00225508BF|nr:uncharacterized protein LOC127795360 isoform X2 [Diospyros lotus]
MAATSLFSGLSPYTCPAFSCRNSPGAGSLSSIIFNVRKASEVCFSSKNKPGFMDQILDYIEGGPKLRKWYGAPDLLPKDGSITEEDESSEEDEVRDAILVTDGDNEIGQMVILSLIVKRIRVKALVKDKRAAVEAFGTYVEVANDWRYKGHIIPEGGSKRCSCNNMPKCFLSQVRSLKGIQHVILLSQLSVYRGTGGIQALMNSTARKLAEEDESIVMALGVPYTIIRAGLLQNSPGRTLGFSFEEGSAARGRLSKEDAAIICVEALYAVPQRGLVFEVVNGEDKVSDWKECLTTLMEKAEPLL